MKHTPGPWQYHIGRGSSPRLHVQNSSGYQIASTPEVGHYEPEAKERDANARLMTAAPEMLAACRSVVNLIDFTDGILSADSCRAISTRLKQGMAKASDVEVCPDTAPAPFRPE